MQKIFYLVACAAFFFGHNLLSMEEAHKHDQLFDRFVQLVGNENSEMFYFNDGFCPKNVATLSVERLFPGEASNTYAYDVDSEVELEDIVAFYDSSSNESSTLCEKISCLSVQVAQKSEKIAEINKPKLGIKKKRRPAHQVKVVKCKQSAVRKQRKIGDNVSRFVSFGKPFPYGDGDIEVTREE